MPLRVCYERCPINPTAATFMLSAMWHGVYPGYYLTFITGTTMTLAARAVSSCFKYTSQSFSYQIESNIIKGALR